MLETGSCKTVDMNASNASVVRKFELNMGYFLLVCLYKPLLLHGNWNWLVSTPMMCFYPKA